jgi:hypothetical protein
VTVDAAAVRAPHEVADLMNAVDFVIDVSQPEVVNARRSQPRGMARR